MPEALEISLEQETGNEGLRRILRLHKTGTSRDDDHEFFFDLIGDTTSTTPLVLDGFVFGVIFIAMQLGRPVKVHGSLSRTACFNLAELQSAWACWRPHKYQRVEIVPDEIVDFPAFGHPPRAISAFSGGVDGTFTAIRHKHKLLGNASYPLTDVLLVHGFDVPLGKPEAFDLLLQRIRPLVDELGLGMKVIRTNLKEASGQYWEDSFGVQLAACLHNYSHDFNYALMGSGEPYSNIFYPWGSTPATDYLMSGDQMQLVLDGSAYTRTEKMETLRHHPTALKTLKVCWEGSNQERNCGVCEKCIRTKLNLLAVGVSDAPCFDEALDPKQILYIRLINDAQLLELQTIFNYVEKRGVEAPWADNLKKRIDAYTNKKKKKTFLEKTFHKISERF
ncbi:hypothetical protein [Thiobacillus denitrificans]|uniref:hypothetical protein n=1 Tax=Thiobacillus denitrificans TaxID=36861 RepID=UPI000ADD7968|nr:hypothetical protein [Thiobacillus denitrificans]